MMSDNDDDERRGIIVAIKKHLVGIVTSVVAGLLVLLIGRSLLESSGSSPTPTSSSTPTHRTPPPPRLSAPVFLSDLSPTGDSPDLGLARIHDASFRRSIEYEIALGEESKTSTYTAPAGATSFRSYVGIDPRDSTLGSPVTFTLYVGGVRAYASPTPVDPNARACSLQLPVSGGTTVKLQMDIGGEGLGRIYAAWADARFVGAMDAPREPKAPKCAGL